MIYKKEKRRLGTTELDKPHQLTTHFIRARMTRFCFYSFFEKKNIQRRHIVCIAPVSRRYGGRKNRADSFFKPKTQFSTHLYPKHLGNLINSFLTLKNPKIIPNPKIIHKLKILLRLYMFFFAISK
jgi:hypothetical protein